MNHKWPDAVILADYLEGKLDNKTMNRLERESLEDPFVLEALEGFSHLEESPGHSLSLLQRQLQVRISAQKDFKQRSVISWQRLSIASAAAVLFIAAGVIFWIRHAEYQRLEDRLMSASQKDREIVIGPDQSIDTTSTLEDDIAAARTPISPERQEIRSNRKDIGAAKPIGEAEDAEPAVSSSVGIATAVPDLTNKIVRFKVTDSISGQPLANASIVIDNVTRGLTDTNGELAISADSLNASAEIIADRSGYIAAYKPIHLSGINHIALSASVDASSQTIARNDRSKLDNRIRPNSLVSRGRKSSDLSVAKAKQQLPGEVLSSGLVRLQNYLIRDNKHSDQVGSGIVLTFIVHFKNNKPANIEIVRGFSKSYDEEVLKLINRYSNWQGIPTDQPLTIILKY